jgi:N-hydroxyarylamine O-acetyltransferase
VDVGGEHELQAELAGEWKPMYRFDLQQQRPIDYDALNHYVATHPDSHFRSRLVVARATLEGRYALGNKNLSIHKRGAPSEHRVLTSADEIKRALVEVFLIDPPKTPDLDAVLASIANESPPA